MITAIGRAIRRFARERRWRVRMRTDRAAHSAAPTARDGDEPIYVFIRSWNRPLYLWASLDSFYRYTETPCRFVLIDNASDDPMVKEIIHAFARRGMFHAIHMMEANDPENQQHIYAQYRPTMGSYVVLVDADVMVAPSSPDWLARMIEVMRSRPALGLLGTMVDPSDFVSIEIAKGVAPNLPPEVLAELIKARSPERRQPEGETADLINPYRPAGRLLLARCGALDVTGAVIGNSKLCAAVEGAGYESGITPHVVHRHLSLLNLFDYPDYDFGQLSRYLGKH